MSEVIVITSGKGGVGKTTTTANIGTGLAQLNKKVVMIDTDIGLRNLDVVMGLENRIVYNLVDVVEGKCRIRQALIKDKKYPDLCLLPSAQTRDKDAVTPEQMVELINELREEFDYILLDCPAGIEQGFKNAVAGADRALVVTTPEVSKRMSNVSLKNGDSERALALAIWHLGLRYRKNYKELPGSPDIALIKHKIAIFVDGEFWHGKDSNGDDIFLEYEIPVI